MNKRLQKFFVMRSLIFIVVVLVSLLGWLSWSKYKIITINSFEKCQAAGYPVQESYPARCAVPGGKTYTQKIPNEEGVCTTEVMQCDDGSFVSRTGPDCEFTACPVQ